MSGGAETAQSLKSKAEAEERYKKLLVECQSLTEDSIAIGTGTLNSLVEQEEKLNDVEDTIDNNQAIITESLRRLRGMTWAGSIYNTVSSIGPALSSVFTPPPPPPPSGSTPAAPLSSSDRESSLRTAPSQASPNSANTAQMKAELFQQEPQPMSEEDRMLEELSRSVASLHSLTVTTGETLDASGKQIERLDAATERLQVETLYASLKAAKITRTKGSGNVIENVGIYQFVLPDSSGLLGVQGDNLVLTPVADRSCLFSCFVRNGAIVGLRSETTMRYVGCTMWGNIAVSADYFGSQEECFVNLKGGLTGLLFLARNFGGGGWLRADKVGEGENGAYILGSTTSNATDQEGALHLMAIKCQS